MSAKAEETIPKETFDKNEMIFRKGEAGNFLYIVESGKVEIYLEQLGVRKTLTTIQDNGMFGEMALIDGKPRSANAKALKKTTCYVIHKDEVLRRMSTLDPFMQAVFKVLLDSIRDKNEHA